MADQIQPVATQPEPAGSQQVVPPAQPAPAPDAAASQTPPAPQSVVPEDEKFFAALAYFGPLFILTLIVKPKSDFCKFHARQSMILLLIFVLFLMVLFAVPMIGSLMTFALFAVYVLAIYRAYKGDLWNIPLVSNFAGKMNIEALYNKAGLAVSGISGLKEKAEGLASKAAETAKSLGKQEEEATPPPPAEPPAPPPAAPPAA